MNNIRLFLGGILVLFAGGCAALREERMVAVSPVKSLTPDSTSVVHVDVDVRVPRKAFSGRSRLIIVPHLMRNDSIVSVCRALVLDAPIYSKKLERRTTVYGYVDPLAANARKIDNRDEIVVPYVESVSVPDTLDGGRIVAIVTTDGCGECTAMDTVDMAYITNVPTLLDPKKSWQLNWIEPEFVVRPKVMQGKGEALLQFLINRHDINLNLGDNREEMNKMLSVLENIVSDSLATLNDLSIYGMASADGSYAFNTTLAENRAASAKRWLVSRLRLSVAQARMIRVGSRPEGWMPVLEAMRKDGHADTSKVQAILEKYRAENDDVAERYIRRLACWRDIRENYLQGDRKVEYEYTYTLKSFTTDEELLDMYGKRPDAFNEDELLRVAVLKASAAEKQEVYRTILHYFPNSQIAANNLAVLLLREGKTEEAEVVINSLENYSPEVINTKAAIYVYRNDYEKAIELLETNVELPEARYNLGLLMARVRNLKEAYALMADYEDTNAAIVALSVNRNEEASKIMEACPDVTPRAEYVRALISARLSEGDVMMMHLVRSVVESYFRQRAATEADFVPYRNRQDFINLIGEGRDE